MKAAPEGVAMTKQRSTERPDFEGERAGIWIGKHELSTDERKTLNQLLPGEMDGTQKLQFMEEVARFKPVSHLGRRETPYGEQQKQLQAVATQAKRLLAAMGRDGLSLDATLALEAHSAELVCLNSPEPPLLEATKAARQIGFLSPHLWDTVKDIETVFSYAAAQLKGDKQDHPNFDNTTGFVANVAAAYFRVTGDWPTTSVSKGETFSTFVTQLAKLAGFGHVGSDKIKAGIKRAKQSD
jgi:hypothetical protein